MSVLLLLVKFDVNIEQRSKSGAEAPNMASRGPIMCSNGLARHSSESRQCLSGPASTFAHTHFCWFASCYFKYSSTLSGGQCIYKMEAQPSFGSVDYV